MFPFSYRLNDYCCFLLNWQVVQFMQFKFPWDKSNWSAILIQCGRDCYFWCVRLDYKWLIFIDIQKCHFSQLFLSIFKSCQGFSFHGKYFTIRQCSNFVWKLVDPFTVISKSAVVHCKLLVLEEGGNSIKACNRSGSGLMREWLTQYPKMLITVTDETVLLSLSIRLYFFAAALNLVTFSSWSLWLVPQTITLSIHGNVPSRPSTSTTLSTACLNFGTPFETHIGIRLNSYNLPLVSKAI